jgi:hypothetical protein
MNDLLILFSNRELAKNASHGSLLPNHEVNISAIILAISQDW